MSDYSYQELMKMQNDAIRRVEDMQKRARLSAGIPETDNSQNNANGNITNNAENITKITKEPPRRVPMPNDYLDNLKKLAANSSQADITDKQSETSTESGKTAHSTVPEAQNIKNMATQLNIDNDKALLLSLILLLSEEQADETLLLALIYMMT